MQLISGCAKFKVILVNRTTHRRQTRTIIAESASDACAAALRAVTGAWYVQSCIPAGSPRIGESPPAAE